MNIVFLYRIYPSFGGVEVVTTLLANEFVKDGHSVSIASFEGGKEGVERQLDSRVKLLRLDRRVMSLRNIRTFKHWCYDNNVDTIINQWGLPFYTSMFVKLSCPNIPLISVLHGSPVVARTLLTTEDDIKKSNSFIKKSYFRMILYVKKQVMKYGLKYNLKVNKQFILLSKSFIPVFNKFANVDNPARLTAIGNPITISTDYSTHTSEKSHNILYVGRMDYPNKRVDRVIDFWGRCHANLRDWHLTMVGDGPYKKDIEEKAKSFPRVSIEPFQEEPPVAYYKKGDILLLTSDLEGFGLVVIEAMSYGVVPVVYGSYEAIYDIIDNGIDGYITGKPFCEQEFDNIVISLCNDNNKRVAMSKSAVRKSKIFSIDSIKRQWYLTLNKAIK